MIENIFVQVINKGVNHFIQLDDQSGQKLQSLQGKLIRIHINDLNLDLSLKTEADKLLIMKDCTDPADTVIRGGPLALFDMWQAQSNGKTQIADDIIIEGDLELATTLMQFFNSIDIDWEEQLAKVVGDVIAHQIGRGGRAIKHNIDRFKENLFGNISEYIQEEKQWSPTSREVSDFYKDIESLRDAVERASLRVRKLARVEDE